MKHKITIGVLIFWVIIGGWVLAQQPIHATPRIHIESDDAVDAVQNNRLNNLESIVMMHASTLVDLQAESNWLKGGLAVIAGLFTVVQIVMPIMKKTQ